MINAEAIIAILPMTPSISPHSNARLAPIAWAEVPNANPLAILLLIRVKFKRNGPIINEKTADIQTNKIVRDGIPPNDWDTDRAIGAVTDFGISDNIISLFMCKYFVNKIIDITPVNVPGMTAQKIIRKFFLIILTCLYKGTARDTVAVPNKSENNPVPNEYWDTWI